MTQFEAWLTKKLQELKTDEGVFLPYILGILEGDEESEEEKAEGITGLLADVLDDEAAIEKTLHEILAAWRQGGEAGQSSVETVTAEVSKLDILEAGALEAGALEVGALEVDSLLSALCSFLQ